MSRAKSTLKEQGSDFNQSNAPANNILSEYVDIIRNGEVKKLEEILSEHITLHGDAGGKGKLLSEFTSGIKAVAHRSIKGYNLYLKKSRIEFTKANRYWTNLKRNVCEH